MSLCDHCILFNLHDKELFFLKQAAESYRERTGD